MPSTSIWLARAEVRLTKRHWRYWFDRMNEFEITQEQELISVHYKLRTGNVKDRTEAGRCVDSEAFLSI